MLFISLTGNRDLNGIWKNNPNLNKPLITSNLAQNHFYKIRI